jgi:putative inorganic carbon (hco3(-)) transporter
MDFFTVKLFLALYYIRPHEWLPLIGSLRPILLTVALAIYALYNRPGGIRRSDLFQTPHDWMMLVYFIWFVGTSRSPTQVFMSVNNVFAFYWITVLTLNSTERLVNFLIWWNIMILAVAGLAVASEYGFDPMNSYEVTHGKMQGRLSLNTSIFDNPNALGHSVVGALVMLYFLGFWNRDGAWKIGTSIVTILPLTCIYMTASKGAFLSGFATLANALTFKRPLAVKILIFTVAGTMGWLALNALPRMQELESTDKNQAINGRVAAFRFGLNAMRTHLTGLGYGNFMERFFEANDYYKTAHSSYVEAGAELGEPGLYLFVGILYCCLRTLLNAKTANTEEERARRALFGLFISYTVSSWMICWTYRATFFLMAGAIAAFHRQMRVHNQPAAAPESPGIEIQMDTPAGIPTNVTAAFVKPDPAPASPDLLGIRWNRVNLLDLAIIALLTLATVQYWSYVMNKMHT